MNRSRALIIALHALTAPLAAQRPLTPVREVTLDGNAADLTAIGGIAVSARGTMAVLQPKDYRLIFVDPSGVVLGKFGRKGEGPGEFQTSRPLIGWNGDTLWMADPYAGRIAWMGPDFKLLRTGRLPDGLTGPNGEPSPPAVRKPYFRTRTDRGELVMEATLGDVLSGAPWLPIVEDDRTLVVKVTSEGRLISLLGRIHRTGIPPCEKRVQTGSFVVPFCASPLIAYGGNASVAAIATANPEANSVELAVADIRTGKPMFSRSVPMPAQRISEAVADSVRRQMLKVESLSKEMHELIASMKFPANYPPLSRLVVGRDRTIWIEQQTAPTAPRRWLALSPAGAPVAVLALPRNTVLMAVQLDRLWASVADEDGVESVVVFKLR